MRTWLAAALVAALGLVALDRIFPPALGRLAETGTEVLDRSGRTVALLPTRAGVWRLRTTPDQVAPVFLARLVAVEDRRFWWHPGVDPLALARAALQWVRAGRVVSGGSTLTMQTVRLLEPRPRTLRSKLIEILRAVQLEAHFSKREILSAWLTLAPYGGNLEGVRAGAQAWCGVAPDRLDAAQAALLVAIPRRPEALRPDRHGQPRLPMPRHAAQAVAALAGPPRVATSLDLGLQMALERAAPDVLRDLPDRASVAMLVADAATREIRAIYAGAWGSEARAGTLDLTRAVRSPGSALKPFLYGLAFQDGIASPQTWLTDLPRHFGSYAPENFDRGHAGQVTAAEALRKSLNLPAVALLDRVGPLRFDAALASAGVMLRLPRGADPSLPLALGGAGITLRQLGGLYAALATDGGVAPLHLAGPSEAPRPLLQRQAAALVADVLTQAFPDGGPQGVAWKTGTSWGGRDAWAAGFDARTVAVVWVGRPDGTPLPGATGRGLALPLLSHIFSILPEAPRHPAAMDGPAAATPAPLDTLRLLFPPPGALLSGDGPITLRAAGGHRPLTFLVDGTPVPARPIQRQTQWTPDGPGFYRLTILDAEGASVVETVRIR